VYVKTAFAVRNTASVFSVNRDAGFVIMMVRKVHAHFSVVAPFAFSAMLENAHNITVASSHVFACIVVPRQPRDRRGIVREALATPFLLLRPGRWRLLTVYIGPKVPSAENILKKKTGHDFVPIENEQDLAVFTELTVGGANKKRERRA
jgi:hypothetical protein